MVLRACYAVSGTDLGMLLRACYLVPGTDVGYAATRWRQCYWGTVWATTATLTWGWCLSPTHNSNVHSGLLSYASAMRYPVLT
eukprot:194015-Rhodomonas_salina.1